MVKVKNPHAPKKTQLNDVIKSSIKECMIKSKREREKWKKRCVHQSGFELVKHAWINKPSHTNSECSNQNRKNVKFKGQLTSNSNSVITFMFDFFPSMENVRSLNLHSMNMPPMMVMLFTGWLCCRYMHIIDPNNHIKRWKFFNANVSVWCP